MINVLTEQLFDFQSKPLWPGKSDLDQLFLICKNLGELLPSQMQLFNGNKFYAGLTIPNPGPIEPLEEKVPVKIIGKDGMDVLKVHPQNRYKNLGAIV